MNKKEIREKLEYMELCNNGLRQISGGYANIRNLRLTKKKAVYDLILGDYNGQSYKRFNECEVDLEVLK